MDTSLRAAIRAGDEVSVGELLSAEANPDLRDSDGCTPLLIAAGRGRSHLVQLLLTAGADCAATSA